VDLLIADLNADLGPDEAHTTEVGKVMGGIRTTVSDFPQTLDNTIDGVLNPILAELRPLLNKVDGLLATLNEPGGVIPMLDGNGALNETIDSLPGLIDRLNDAVAPLPGLIENLNGTTASLPGQLPIILTQLRTVLRSVDDVMVGLANNPLLRGGVPERPVTQTTGPRDIRF
jgi:phospholipid/cholesterol/gamma-HCH transport system substrate-binding protein